MGGIVFTGSLTLFGAIALDLFLGAPGRRVLVAFVSCAGVVAAAVRVLVVGVGVGVGTGTGASAGARTGVGVSVRGGVRVSVIVGVRGSVGTRATVVIDREGYPVAAGGGGLVTLGVSVHHTVVGGAEDRGRMGVVSGSIGCLVGRVAGAGGDRGSYLDGSHGWGFKADYRSSWGLILVVSVRGVLRRLAGLLIGTAVVVEAIGVVEVGSNGGSTAFVGFSRGSVDLAL